MPADVENMVSAREVPWHRMGTVVDDVMTAQEALKKSGLNWRVTKEPMYVGPPGFEHPVKPDGPVKLDGLVVPDRFAVRRSRDHKVLGVVGAPYQPLQNVDAFDFMDSLVDSSEAKYETAGSLRGGKWVFMTMKVPKGIKVAGKDAIDLYLALFNAHDGSKAITSMVTPIRVVCTNTLNLALSKARRRWSVRHVGNLDGKLAEARRTLDLTFEFAGELEEELDKLAQQSYTDSEFERLVKQLEVPEKVGEGLLAGWATSETHGRSNRYDALNAIGEYFDWGRDPRTPNAQLMGSWFGDGVKYRDRAYSILSR